MDSDVAGSTPMMEGGRLLADRYRLLEKVGEGGAAEVFRARDQRLDRMVAIKLLRSQYTHDESSRRRFVIEAKTAAALSHPNVVDIYDFGEAPDGAMFIAMQFIQGRNLKELLRKRGRLSPAETISITRQACYALSAAHSNGLIHRDVKPQNILIDKQGHAHLTDFGIVKALSGPALTQSGMTFGTAAYMSPEQATGGSITGQSDLYSLGCVMYEMLAGTPPFTGDNPAVVAYKQVWDQPRPLHELVPEVPPSLESVVMRLLNKDPGRRYPSALALASDLDGLSISSNQPTQAVPIPGVASGPGVSLHNEPPAEVGQPVQMPAAPAASTVASASSGMTPVPPPARLEHTPVPLQPVVIAPASMQPTRLAPAHSSAPSRNPAPQPAYSVAPYAAQPARGVQVNVTNRRGSVAWLPVALLLLLGLAICGLAAWQGRGLFSSGNSATPTTTLIAIAPAPPTDTAAPTATATVALGGIIVASPAVPSPQPPPSNTPAPSTPTSTPLPPTGTPQDTPSDTPVPPSSDTPVPTPTIEEATVAPTDVVVTPTDVAPTDTPIVGEVPTDTPVEGPPTEVPTLPAAGAPNQVIIEDSQFGGGYTRDTKKYHNTTAHWVYGQGTKYSIMTSSFTVAAAPIGGAYLTIRGLDSEDTAKTPISISINGQTIYIGADPLPNDFQSGPDAPGNWGSYTWTIPTGVLQSGSNSLTIRNLSPSNKINSPPFFMLDYAVIGWQ